MKTIAVVSARAVVHRARIPARWTGYAVGGPGHIGRVRERWAGDSDRRVEPGRVQRAATALGARVPIAAQLRKEARCHRLRTLVAHRAARPRPLAGRRWNRGQSHTADHGDLRIKSEPVRATGSTPLQTRVSVGRRRAEPCGARCLQGDRRSRGTAAPDATNQESFGEAPGLLGRDVKVVAPAVDRFKPVRI